MSLVDCSFCCLVQYVCHVFCQVFCQAFSQEAGRSAKLPGTFSVCARWSSVRQAGVSASRQGPQGQGPAESMPVRGRSAKLVCQHRARELHGFHAVLRSVMLFC